MTHDLIARALAGDETAARELHDAHYPAVLRLAYLLLRDWPDAAEAAQDATQEAFIYAFENLEHFDPQRASFLTWLKIIVTSRCRDAQRRRANRARFRWLSLHELLDSGHEPEDDAPAHQPEDALAQLDREHVVWQALNRLPGKSRQALILRYFGELSYAEIAAALGCSISAAKARVLYGHRALAELLEGSDVRE